MIDLFTFIIISSVVVSVLVCLGAAATSKAILYFMERY